MAGPSSDFNALYQQRIEASTNGQAASFNELMARAVALAEKEVAAMPVAAHTPPLLLPKDLLPSLRQAENPKESAYRAVQDYIERSQNGLQRPTLIMNSFQTIASFNVTSNIAPFGIRKF